MRNVLAFLAAMAFTFFGLGYYLNWYQIVTVPGPDGHSRVTIDIDGNKIKQDVAKGAERGAEKLQEFMDSSKKGDTARKADAARGESAKGEAAADPARSEGGHGNSGRVEQTHPDRARKTEAVRGPTGE